MSGWGTEDVPSYAEEQGEGETVDQASVLQHAEEALDQASAQVQEAREAVSEARALAEESSHGKAGTSEITSSD